MCRGSLEALSSRTLSNGLGWMLRRQIAEISIEASRLRALAFGGYRGTQTRKCGCELMGLENNFIENNNMPRLTGLGVA